MAKEINNNELIEKIFTEGYFDENDFNKTGSKMVPQVVLVHSRLDGVSICWGEEGSNFSVNPFRVDVEGNVYVSGASNGGTVKARGIPLFQAVAKYNKDHEYGKGGIFSQLAIITREQWLSGNQ